MGVESRDLVFEGVEDVRVNARFGCGVVGDE